MTDVAVSSSADKPEDGRNLSVQQLLDRWLAIPPQRRRWVLRELYWAEQGRLTGRTKRTMGRTVDEAVEDTRAARWLLRGISKAMDPEYDKPQTAPALNGGDA